MKKIVSKMITGCLVMSLLCGCLRNPQEETVQATLPETSIADSTTLSAEKDTTGEAMVSSENEDITTEEATEMHTETQAPAMAKEQFFYTDDSLHILRISTKWDSWNTAVQVYPWSSNRLLIAQQMFYEGDFEEAPETAPLLLQIYDLIEGQVLREIELQGDFIDPYHVHVIDDERFMLYSWEGDVYFYDQNLEKIQESKLAVVGESFDALDGIVWSEDGRYGYTAWEQTILKYDFETGKAHELYTFENYGAVSVHDVLFDEQIISVYMYKNGVSSLVFVDLEKGEIVLEDERSAEVYTSGDQYYALLGEQSRKSMNTVVFYGNRRQKNQISVMQLPEDYKTYDTYLDEENGGLLHVDSTEGGSLSYFDFDGDYWYYKENEQLNCYYSYVGNINEDTPVLLASLYDEEPVFYIALWNYSAQTPETEQRGEQQAPIWDGFWGKYQKELPELSADYDVLQGYADMLESQYGVTIYIAQECEILKNVIYDYECRLLTDTGTIAEALQGLEYVLGRYPKGFFQQFKTANYPEGLCIYLCGELVGVEDMGGLSTAGALTQTSYEQHIVAIDSSMWVDGYFYHEMSHVIDNHIQAENYSMEQPVFDEDIWGSMNPEGYEYLGNYTIYEEGVDDTNTVFWSQANGDQTKDQVYFIDTYAKLFPGEDRARIMEYMFLNMDSYLAYPHIQEKMKYMNQYIRAYFNTDGWPEVTPWEQWIHS